MPELLLVRSGGRHLLTVCAIAGPAVDPAEVRSSAAARLSVAPRPAAAAARSRRRAARSRSAPPARRPSYEEAVADAVGSDPQRSRRQARPRPRGHGHGARRPFARGAVRRALRDAFSSCFCFCVGTPEAAFVGASPELLARRSGGVAATVALAGSARRSADPAVDDHLGEQLLHSAKDRNEHAIVVRRIERRLAPLSVWVEIAPEPVVIKVANIQHLATPIHAQLAESHSVLELAELLHPTPAVGPEPRGEEGERLIAELEGLDRGWYAGPVGWMDSVDDGEFCVGLRSALLRDRTAHLFAGAGHRRRLGSRLRARGDRDQARRATAAARRLNLYDRRDGRSGTKAPQWRQWQRRRPGSRCSRSAPHLPRRRHGSQLRTAPAPIRARRPIRATSMTPSVTHQRGRKSPLSPVPTSSAAVLQVQDGIVLQGPYTGPPAVLHGDGTSGAAVTCHGRRDAASPTSRSGRVPSGTASRSATAPSATVSTRRPPDPERGVYR